MTVYIKGKEAPPAARLLDALTRCGLLDARCTWEEIGGMIRLTIKDATDKDVRSFITQIKYTTTR